MIDGGEERHAAAPAKPTRAAFAEVNQLLRIKVLRRYT